MTRIKTVPGRKPTGASSKRPGPARACPPARRGAGPPIDDETPIVASHSLIPGALHQPSRPSAR